MICFCRVNTINCVSIKALSVCNKSMQSNIDKLNPVNRNYELKLNSKQKTR